MRKAVRKNSVTSVLYGGYAGIVLAFLDPFHWISDEPGYMPLVLSFLGITLISFAVTHSMSRIGSNSTYLNYAQLTGILAAPVITALSVFYFYSGSENLFLFLSSFLLLLVPPFALSILYSVFDELKNKLNAVGTRKQDDTETAFPILQLKSDQGKIYLEIALDKVVCFEANDNYVITHFLNENSEKSKSMDRISLKKISELLDDLQVGFARVHKSYLVNPAFVKEVRGKSQAYRVILKHHEIEIPVSRSFDISALGA